MISLDIDTAYLCSRYNIGIADIQKYRKLNMSIKQIMKAEAEQGNNSAASMLAKLTNDPEELARLLQLANPINRYIILSHMNTNDLLMIIEYLDTEEMVLGLSVFNEDVLIMLMMKMKPEALAKVVLSQMDADKFLKIIPEEFLDQFLASDKLNRDMLMEALASIDEEQLQKMMERFTGVSCYEQKENILAQMAELDDDEFMSALFMFEPEGKQKLIFGLLQQKPELFEEFSAEAMVFPFKSMKKEDVLRSLMVLKTEDMMPMAEDMPQEILSLIASQIDPKIFSKILCSDFADVIAQCGMKL